jgi:hypothetical protein
MAALDKEKKSSRLLASRRYTHETLSAAQESFTNVLDLQAAEIYTQAGYLPSSELPFSGSSQQAATHTVSGSGVLKYWYRHRLTKSNTNNEVWFFLSPTGSNSGIGAQLIDNNQQVNFVSPKYSVSALATSTTEDSTPGYLATLLKSTANSITGSDFIWKSTGGEMLVNDNSDALMFKIENKMVVLGAVEGAPPTATAGGLYFSGSDEWFFGYDDVPA